MVVGPLLREQMPEAELIVRMFTREVLTCSGDKKFYQGIRFVEPEFIDIFAFDYLRGAAASALADPSGLIITETTAEKYFSDANPMGGVLTMGAEGDFVFPEGWPPSVNKAEYFREYLGDRIPQAGPPADETEDTEMHRQYRELVGEGGD